MTLPCDFSCETMNRFRVDLPYPPAEVARPSRRNAKLLSSAYGGHGSEMTAITQYISHNFFTADYPDVHEALEYIAITEMTHLNLLGKLILKLGVNPVIGSLEDNTWWSGKYPDYQTQIGAILLADIQGEKEAIAHYRRIISQVDDAHIVKLLERIILDEEKHIEVLTPLYLKYR